MMLTFVRFNTHINLLQILNSHGAHSVSLVLLDSTYQWYSYLINILLVHKSPRFPLGKLHCLSLVLGMHIWNIYLKIPRRQRWEYDTNCSSSSAFSWTLFNCTSGECLARYIYKCILMQLASVTAAQFWIKLMQQSRPPSVVSTCSMWLCPCRLGVNDLHLKTFPILHSPKSILTHFEYSTFAACQKLWQ